MKRFIAASLLLLFLGVLSAFPQADVIIKNKAKAIRDNNNARQGIETSPPPAPATPPPPVAPSGPQGIAPAQQAMIDKLESDISDIKAGAKVADDQKKQMQADTVNLAKGGTKPSPQSLTNLVNHLSAALAVKDVALRDPAPAQLARDINIVVNSINLSSGQSSGIITSVQTLLRSAGVPEDNYKTVVADLKAIVTELQKNKPKLYQ